MWAKLSLKYTTPNLGFAKVDVDSIPELVKEYNISSSGLISQLPYIILFKNGEIEDTYPGKDPKGRPYQSKYYREKEITKFFELDEIYASTANSKSNQRD